MNKRAAFAICVAILGLSASSLATETPNFILNQTEIRSDGSHLAKAAGDTILLMGPTGSGAPFIGDFEAGWNGWTSVDATVRDYDLHWQVSDYNQTVPGNLAAWCGDLSLPSCYAGDPEGGYGNLWHEFLTTALVVADPASLSSVRVTATLQTDLEPGYDYVYLTSHPAFSTNYFNLASWGGKATHAVDEVYSVLPAEYVDGNTIVVSFRLQTDGGFSDEDCQYPSAGACQIDNITVAVSQAGQSNLISFTDFQDGTLGPWTPTMHTGVGDFAQLWTGLHDMDPCATNMSQQVAFIDDGVVQPATGGSECIDWCYGPTGYIVNTTGGLVANSRAYLWNMVWSPVMAWPDDTMDGALLSFDVYVHEELAPDSPGIFTYWDLWSMDIEYPDHSLMPPRIFVGYGGPNYRRREIPLGDLFISGRDSIQVALGAYELGWAWGWTGDNGTPAPYFDNVRLQIFGAYGPTLVAQNVDLAQDNFPEVDAIDFADLGSMHVRFDMAKNISAPEHMRNDPGDSIVVDVRIVRTGATLSGVPEMHYAIGANPVFDPYRTTPTSGVILGVPAVGTSGVPDPEAWAFDLPDTGTLFPGDILHYYFRAGDEVDGVVEYNTLPADITGFGAFGRFLEYDTRFVMYALPTVESDGFGGFRMDKFLVWNDGMRLEEEGKWFSSYPFSVPDQVDVYRTRDPAAGVGNGLGGRTGGPSLDHYDVIVYTSGELAQNTLSNGDYTRDAGNDLATLANWHAGGDRDLFLTGDNLASDLALNQGTAGVAFLQQVMGVDWVATDLRQLINNQPTPLVQAIPGNRVIYNISTWIAYGACPGINSFDAVTPRPEATRVAEFTDPMGNAGSYPYSPATLMVNSGTNRAVFMPYDWANIMTPADQKSGAPLASRVTIMLNILSFFGTTINGMLSDVPTAPVFAVSAYPNPFNPATRLDYTVGHPGHLTLKIYNLRGQLVRTLIDGQVESDGFVMWDGKDENGTAVASGIYFREARFGAETLVGKMALVK